MLINVPWEDISGDHLTHAEILANEIQHYAPETFGHVERLDFEVYALAKTYIMAGYPKVMYIDFGDTDEYAHAGKYDHYLLDTRNLDAMIKKLWDMMQEKLSPVSSNEQKILGRSVGRPLEIRKLPRRAHAIIKFGNLVRVIRLGNRHI